MSNILIVGANRGIGYHLVNRLLEKGDKVCVLDVQIDQIEELKKSYPDTLLGVLADAADDITLADGVSKAITFLGKIDIAIHNACMCTFDSEADTGLGVYEQVMNVNYFGALRLSKKVLPYMREQKKGRIIFTSSGVGVTGFGKISPYASSKGAIESLAKCLEIENQEYGISFHIMHPPLTDTASSSGLPVPKEFMAKAEAVGRGLADRINSDKFVICHSFSQAIQVKLCYRHPLYMGKMMWKMTQRAKNK